MRGFFLPSEHLSGKNSVLERTNQMPSHDFGWTGACVYCGAQIEQVQDNLVSPNCDVLLRRQNTRIAIPVLIGVVISLVLIAGMFL